VLAPPHRCLAQLLTTSRTAITAQRPTYKDRHTPVTYNISSPSISASDSGRPSPLLNASTMACTAHSCTGLPAIARRVVLLSSPACLASSFCDYGIWLKYSSTVTANPPNKHKQYIKIIDYLYNLVNSSSTSPSAHRRYAKLLTALNHLHSIQSLSYWKLVVCYNTATFVEPVRECVFTPHWLIFLQPCRNTPLHGRRTTITEGILVVSSNPGRYAINEPSGRDLTSGNVCQILLGGHWIAGSIEGGAVYSIEALPHQEVKGYYFTADNGERCGLCTGMQVRIR
jgi:hypothetical protein